MPFQVIPGTFMPSTGRPDGDSCRFRPDNPDLVFRLDRNGRAPKINQNNGTIGLRYEGIDALESSAIQPFSGNATLANLDLLNLQDENDESRGFLLARQTGPNGRIIAFVYSSDVTVPQQVNFDFFLDSEFLRQSVNFRLIEMGHVYPLFYDTLFFDLRNAFIEGLIAARANNLNIWGEDLSNTGVTWEGANGLANMAPIFPKLWRRLQKYAQDDEFAADSHSLNRFEEYLEDKNDRVFVLSQAHKTSFSNIVEIEGENVHMNRPPEDLIFDH